MPLCLNCHRGVGHYNSKLPKGMKFSADELRGHRDQWHRAVANGVMPGAPSDYVEIDRKLHLRLYKKIGGNNIIGDLLSVPCIKENNYNCVVGRLSNFIKYVENPQVDFYCVDMAVVFDEINNTIRSLLKCNLGIHNIEYIIRQVPNSFVERDQKIKELREKYARAYESIKEV